MDTLAVLDAALAWARAGVSVIPAAADGTKAPLGQWRAYTTQRPDERQLMAWFGTGHPGIGVVCGAVSGGLEMLELEGRAVDESMLEALRESAAAHGLAELWGRLAGGYVERTPSGGLHWLYRVTGEWVPGNTRLASRSARDDELTAQERALLADHPHRTVMRVLAETRGEGGFVVVAPSHGPVHPTGAPWEALAGAHAGQLVSVTSEERAELHRLVAAFDQPQTPRDKPSSPFAPTPRPGMVSAQGSVSPGDDFERRTDWADGMLLGGAGWTRVTGSAGRYCTWRRPGKQLGISATTGHSSDRDRLYVLTTSTLFDASVPYTKLGAYAVLHHGGDHAAAARELSRLGFGVRPAPASTSTPLPPSAPAGPGTPIAAPVDVVRRIKLTPASQIKPRRARWLWDARVPMGEITLVAGREGAGKSTLLSWLVRAITRGELEGEHHGTPRGVLYAAAEDSWNHTVVPRMIAAGADLDRVFRVEVAEELYGNAKMVLPHDIGEVFQAGAEVDASCLMLDPGLSFLDDRIDTFRTPEVRPALEALRKGAELAQVAVLMLCHFNKSTGTDVLTKIAGARAFAEVARAALAVAVDMPDDDDDDDDSGEDKEPVIILSQVKNNLGRSNLPSLTYAIREAIVETDEGDTRVGRLHWTGTSDRTAEQALNAAHGGGGGSGRGRPLSAATLAVLAWIKAQGRTVAASEVVNAHPGIKADNLRKILQRGVDRGVITRPFDGHYAPVRPAVTEVVSQSHSVPSPGQTPTTTKTLFRRDQESVTQDHVTEGQKDTADGTPADVSQPPLVGV